MTIGGSLVLIAAGAILKYAVTARTEGIDLQTTGVILMAVGGLALVLSLLFWASGRSGGVTSPPEL
jgi:hypothetical protein